MEEYEYSLNVSDIKPFIKYCVDNNYQKVSEYEQRRIVYESALNNNLIARMTTNNYDGRSEVLFDIKSIKKKDNNLKYSKETMPMIVTEENNNIVLSIIDVLEFKECSNLIRKRYVYEKDGVIFEIDDYQSPKMKVVAIEGIKNKVDKVYKEICIAFNIEI